jgi:RNA polymerase sigma factor (sigma-70 family)
MQSLDDADPILANVMAGDIETFEVLYWRPHQRIYAVCLRMTSNFATAEDITQHVFIKLFQKIGTFQQGAALSTWLHCIAVNEVLTHFRISQRRKNKIPERISDDLFATEGMRHRKSTGSIFRMLLDGCQGHIDIWSPFITSMGFGTMR